MGAKHPFLHVARAVVVMKIEPGLADADNPLVRGEQGEIRGAQRRVVGCLVRVDADRAPDVGIRLGDRPHPGELIEAGPDRQHRPDPGGAGTRDDRVPLLGEIRKIEMAMAVDQHSNHFVGDVAGLVSGST